MELYHIGKHCASPSCNQLDFLPFDCRFCSKSYCATHRIDHPGCSGPKDAQIPTCPRCNSPIPTPPGTDPNITVNRHLNQCLSMATPTTTAKKPTCAKPGCSQQLTLTQRINCGYCQRQFCSRHRVAEDHLCAKLPGRKPSPSTSTNLNLLQARAQQTAASWAKWAGNLMPKTTTSK